MSEQVRQGAFWPEVNAGNKIGADLAGPGILNSRAVGKYFPKKAYTGPDLVERAQIARMYNTLADDERDPRLKLAIEREADRYYLCGQVFRIYRCTHCSHTYRLRSSCNSRICETCGRRLYRSIRAQLLESCRPFFADRQKTYGPKFLTLTFAAARFGKDGPTRAQYARCQRLVSQFIGRFYGKYKARCSRNGRWYASKTWRGAGAISVPELGRSGLLHFHCFVYGPYIPQAHLSQAWRDMTGDSFIVDIRPVRDPAKVASYILKYITKAPAQLEFFATARWAWLLKGTRRLCAYGVLYGQVRTKKKVTRFPLICVFDGRDLEYAGDSTDRRNILLDWASMASYLNDRAGPYFAPLPRDGWLDKHFKPEWEVDSWRTKSTARIVTAS